MRILLQPVRPQKPQLEPRRLRQVQRLLEGSDVGGSLRGVDGGDRVDAERRAVEPPFIS